MRRFTIATALTIVLSATTALSATAAPMSPVATAAPAVLDAGSTSAIPWLCRIFGLCCER